MKRNKSLATIGATAVLAIATFGTASAQGITTSKKGSPQAARELTAAVQNSVAVKAETPSQDKGERGAKRMEQLQQRLNLTAEQSAKIQTILQNAREKGKAAREQAGGDKEAFKTAMKENMRNTDAEIKGVLTAEQAQKYAELKAEMKAKHENREGKHEGHKKQGYGEDHNDEKEQD
jgi:Spy/CpxP family protein refolding chaperone